MKNKTFIILTPGFPKDESDSTCLPAQQLFVKMLKEQYPLLDVIVLTFQYPFAASVYQWHNCRVIALGGKGKGKLFRLMLWHSAWKKLKALTKGKTVLGLLSFWCGECALLANRFGKKHHIQHLCWILGQDAKSENNYVQRIKPKAKELIAMSDFLQNTFFANHGIKPAVVIPNGIDPRSFPEKPLTRDIDILGAGSLIPLKQYEIFISIIANIKKTIPGIKAVICGKGPEANSLKVLINNEGLQENIKLMGELAHQEVLRLMQRSSLFLHTSNYEGFGSVCIEALYAGAHVVSFNYPMKTSIAHWQQATNPEMMLQMCLNILQQKDIEHNSVYPLLMEDSVTKMMQLFDH